MESETIKVMNQDMVKLDRFDGNNFARWRDKMMFLLTALKISYILDPNLAPIEDPAPTTEGQEPNAEEIERVNKAKKKREEDELLCRGHILNTLSDRLYDLFTEMKSAREIWDALEFKYKAEEQGTNRDRVQAIRREEAAGEASAEKMKQIHALSIRKALTL